MQRRLRGVAAGQILSRITAGCEHRAVKFRATLIARCEDSAGYPAAASDGCDVRGPMPAPGPGLRVARSQYAGPPRSLLEHDARSPDRANSHPALRAFIFSRTP